MIHIKNDIIAIYVLPAVHLHSTWPDIVFYTDDFAFIDVDRYDAPLQSGAEIVDHAFDPSSTYEAP